MEKIVCVHNLTEKNGKTIKENNMELKHNIPLGSLVEIIPWDEESEEKYGGLRVWVVEQERDFDGTPMYGISHDKEMIGKTQEKPKEDDHYLMKLICFANNHNLNRGFSEDSLKVIKKGK